MKTTVYVVVLFVSWSFATRSLVAQPGTAPLAANVAPQLKLGYWRFDSAKWLGDQGQVPLYASPNLQLATNGWITNAVKIDSATPARLAYRDVETNGLSNLDCRNGSLRFHFKPDWNYGAGPNDGRLMDVGDKQSPNGWWALMITNHGSDITFVGQTNGLRTNYLTASLASKFGWNSNTWYSIELTYSPSNSSLYVVSNSPPSASLAYGSYPPAGVYPLIANGSGVVYYPNRAGQALTGFSVGSDKDGNNQAQGVIDELETFNYPLDIRVGTLPDHRQSVPTSQILQMPGQRVSWYSGWPLDLALSPDGKTVYIKDRAWVRVLSATNWSVVGKRVPYPARANGSDAIGSIHGIAASRDGSHVYVTSAENELYEYTTNGGSLPLTISRTNNLPVGSEPCGIALSTNGITAYVCLSGHNALAMVDLTNGTVAGLIHVGVAPYAVVLSPDEKTAYVSDYGGRVPTPGDLTRYSWGRTHVVVNTNGIVTEGRLSIVNLVSKTVTEVSTGLYPCDLALSHDGSTLYVANANSDTVTVIDTALARNVANIPVRPATNVPYLGSAPNALALSPDGGRLYVANGGNNAIAVINTTNHQVLGFIPTDWYPGALAVDDHQLYVANVKGLGAQLNEYYDVSLYRSVGTANKIPIPSDQQLSNYTAQVLQNGRVAQMLATTNPPQAGLPRVPVPKNVGEPSVFQHVFYIIKENKTYDQMFGDLPQGNGLSSLCIYGNYVTPNQHALAAQFVLLDNFYCIGVDSFDGHFWSTEGNASLVMEKFGSHRRNGASEDALGYSASGFIWANVLNHGLAFTNYGERAGSYAQADWSTVYGNYVNGAYPNGRLTNGQPAFHASTDLPNLEAHTSLVFPGWDSRLSIPDILRAEVFIHDLTNADHLNRAWPAFTIMALPNDHTAATLAGSPTPSVAVADNDLATGRVVEAISRSRFWSNSVIFVIEDDPQSGWDHVDGHRSICLVISPYTKRRQTISNFYNQTGVLHTMEQILGIPPMNQMDALAPLMTDCFNSVPDLTPYSALPNNVPLDGVNPGINRGEHRLTPKAHYWARQSIKLDFSRPDAADDTTLNRILWYSMKGDVPYPARYAGAHGRGLKQLGLVIVKSQKDLDD